MSAMRVSSRVRKSRTYSLLGTCGLLAITVIQLPKAVDLLHELRSRHAHQSGMMSGALTPKRSAELDQQLQELNAELAELEGAMIGVDQMPDIQSELMEDANGCHCRLRKAVGQTGAAEDWMAEQGQSANQVGGMQEESPYQLAKEHLNLSLEGTLEQTLDFLGRLRKHHWLMKVSRISLSRSLDDDGRLAAEISLSFYKLTKTEQEQEHLIDWQSGPQPPPDVQ